MDPTELLNTQIMLLTKPQTYLRKIGIRDVEVRRRAYTFHEQALTGRWAWTIGMWGGVATHEGIMRRTGATYANLKMFRQRNALQTKPSRSQWDLAVSAYVKWLLEGEANASKAPAIAAHFGILPIELRIYFDRVDLIRVELGIEPSAILDDENYQKVGELWTPHSEAIDAAVLSTYSQLNDG